jgi:multiple sugar transport system substrate-binding protein
MKTRLIIFLLIFVLPVTACAQPTAQPPTAVPIAAPTEASVTITWLIRNGTPELNWNIKVIKDYVQLHPNIKLNPVMVEGGPPYLQRFKDLARSGTPVDVWSTAWGGSFNDYIQMDAVADLTPLIERDKVDLSDFLPETLQPYTVSNKIMGLPFASYGSFIYYNKDVFDRAGVAYPTTNWDDATWTWDTYQQKCKVLTLTTADASKDIYGCLSYSLGGHIYQWLWGKDLFPESAYQTGFADTAFLDDPLAIQARQAQRDLIWKYKVAPDSINSLYVYTSGRWGMGLPIPGWWEPFNDGMPKNWALAALPYGWSSRRGLIWTDSWMLSSKSSHPEESWQFLKYLSSPEVQREYMTMVRATPARASLLEEWYKSFPNMTPEQVRQVYLGALKYGREAPDHMIIGWDDQLMPILQKADDAIWKNDQPVAEILHGANQELIKALKQIQSQQNQ